MWSASGVRLEGRRTIGDALPVPRRGVGQYLPLNNLLPSQPNVEPLRPKGGTYKNRPTILTSLFSSSAGNKPSMP